MKKTVLHIGTHKTGSTFIQTFLFSNKQKLPQLGYCFPDFGEKTSAKGHRDLSQYLRKGGNDPKLDIFTEKESARRIILSSEDFCYCHPDEIDDAKNLLGENVKIVCYLREPTSHLISMYYQSIQSKKSLYLHFPAYLDNAIQKTRNTSPEVSNPYYNYDNLEESWKAVFNDSNFIVYSKFKPEELLRSFFTAADIVIPSLDDFSFERTNANTSPSPETIFVHLSINKLRIENKLSNEQHSIFRAHIRQKGIGELKDQISDWIEYPLNGFIDIFNEENPKWSLQFNNHIESFKFPSEIHGGEKEILDWLCSNVKIV